MKADVKRAMKIFESDGKNITIGVLIDMLKIGRKSLVKTGIFLQEIPIAAN